MANFQMPSGGTGQPQSTPSVPGVTNGPNPKAAMGSTGRASESAGVSTMGDAYKVMDATGTSVATDMGTNPVTAVPTPDGGPGNLASEDPKAAGTPKNNKTTGNKVASPPRQSHAAGGVANTWNPAFGPKPASRK